MVALVKNRDARAADRVANAGSAEDLGMLEHAGVEAVIWDRQLPAHVVRALQGWPPRNVENARIVLPRSRVASGVADVLDAWGGLDAEMRQWLCHDIALLAEQVAQTLGVERLHLRVEHVHDDACRRFHKDAVRARLICTYSGPGTQIGYVDQDGQQPEHADDVPTGSPIFLRGKHWRSSRHGQLLHRSPPIETAGLSRLVVVIDEAAADLVNGPRYLSP